MMSTRHVLILAGCLSLTGCAQVAYVYRSNAGLDLAVAPTEGHVQVSIGADREMYAAVPRRNDNPDSDAMAVMAISKVRIAGLRDLRFGHVIATGKPAVLMSQDPDETLPALVDTIFGLPPKEGGK
jgi:hypothetical protein